MTTNPLPKRGEIFTNNLTKVSAVDVLQLRGMDIQRFIRRLGCLPSEKMSEVTAAIAAVVEFD